MRRVLAIGVTGVLLAGCGGGLTSRQKLQDLTAEVVARANAKDVTGLKAAANAMNAEVATQSQSGALTDAQTATLKRYLAAIFADSDLLTAPTPGPTPSATTASPTPSATTASPTPSPTHSPTPSPTPSQTPSPTGSPTPTQTIVIGGSSSPSASAAP